jgi:hypothetical protein
MNAAELRAALKLEEVCPGVQDWTVHNFAMWYYQNNMDVLERGPTGSTRKFAEGLVEEYITDDEELMVQFAVFLM